MSLIEDILDLAKLEAGTFSLNEEPFLIRKLIEDIDFIFGFQCAQKRIYFKTQSSRELKNMTFVSDLGRIKQVLMNLISNAFKFTTAGGITLQVRLKTIFDEFEFRRVNTLKFKVIDTGAGIAENDIPQLFSMFRTFSKDKNRQYNTRGTGLGLFISKKIVESLNGNIHAKSQINKGTEISFTIRESCHKEYQEECKEAIESRMGMNNPPHETYSDISDSDTFELVECSKVRIPLFSALTITSKCQD